MPAASQVGLCLPETKEGSGHRKLPACACACVHVCSQVHVPESETSVVMGKMQHGHKSAKCLGGAGGRARRKSVSHVAAEASTTFAPENTKRVFPFLVHWDPVHQAEGSGSLLQTGFPGALVCCQILL